MEKNGLSGDQKLIEASWREMACLSQTSWIISKSGEGGLKKIDCLLNAGSGLYRGWPLSWKEQNSLSLLLGEAQNSSKDDGNVSVKKE